VSRLSQPAERDQEPIRAAIEQLFGPRTPAANAYADLLGTAGVERGLIGPRESDRIWERHILNSAVLASLVPADARVVDLGSGAGLPGIPLAIARPDLTVVLLEPMQRRVTFLQECVDTLELPRVSVHRGRAEEGIEPLAEVVVARAVASLPALVRLSFPLLAVGGVLLALKGRSAGGELDQVRRTMAVEAETVSLPAPGEPATVVRVQRPARAARRARGRSR
jgi:16S rRNA (guanine527-N7)-methyltransferase